MPKYISDQVLAKVSGKMGNANSKILLRSGMEPGNAREPLDKKNTEQVKRLRSEATQAKL